jgi:hypothetical protein
VIAFASQLGTSTELGAVVGFDDFDSELGELVHGAVGRSTGATGVVVCQPATVEKVNRPFINRAELIKIARNEKSPTRMCASGLEFFEREKGLEPSTSTLARRPK